MILTQATNGWKMKTSILKDLISRNVVVKDPLNHKGFGRRNGSIPNAFGPTNFLSW
jgi:hypothetical protein